VANWLAATLDQHLLDRTALAFELLHEVDADLSRCAETLARALEKVNATELAEYLDEADAADHGRFAGLMVRLDAIATPLTFQVMKHATRSRTRAAAATALCYQCAEAPGRLQPYVDDPQADVVLNLVFVLGQIGGPGVIDMLKFAALHPDPRVRRQAVLSMGGAPEKERVPALLDGLARLDPHILGTTLAMLARRQDEQVWRFILGLIEDPEFEHRGEDVQRALFHALAEVAEDSAVPALDRILNRVGGFMKKRTFTQLAAAEALKRIGTPAARAVLEAGIGSKHAAVRSACGDVLQRKAA
jgi:HEAT repeat protein